MITAKTGEAGASNSISFVGAKFAVDTINERGGVLGRVVELIEYDNESTPEGSASAARKAVRDGVAAVVGCNWSSHSTAMAAVLQQAGIPMISHMSTNPDVTRVGDYIFRICFTDSFQGACLARFSRETLNAETAAVLVDSRRDYSKGLATTFTKAFEAVGGKVVLRDSYSAGNMRVDGILRAVDALDPDVLFVPGSYADCSAFFDRAKELGIRADRLSGDGIGSKMYDFIGERAEGIYFSGHWSRWVDTVESKDFVRRFESSVRSINEDTYALVYDSFMVLADAIKRAGSVKGEAIRDALARTPGFNGVTGLIRFDENGDPIKPVTISQLRYGGVLYLEQVSP